MSNKIDPYQSLQCVLCKYTLGDGLSCVAFPDGMPPEVIAGTVPCPGNNGVKFRMRGEPKGERKHLKLVKPE